MSGDDHRLTVRLGELAQAHADRAAARAGVPAVRLDRLAAEAAHGVDCDVIALAQFSLARAAPVVAQATGKPVLTTAHSAVRRLRQSLGAG